jgi:TRAP-type C4-dicarboxylate transport system permease small subunit
MEDVLTSRIGRLNGLITLWLARIAALALALIAVVTFCDVIARKLFNKGFTFTVEMTEMAMALIVFLGVGLITHQRGHIVVDVLTLRLSERARVWLGLVTNMLSLGFVMIMVWRLWLQAAFIASKGDTLVTGLVLHLIDSMDRAAHPGRSAPEAAERPYQD